jgi:hypothetical protein
MREIRLFGSEGGAPIGVPTPIKAGKLSGAAQHLIRQHDTGSGAPASRQLQIVYCKSQMRFAGHAGLLRRASPYRLNVKR